MFQRKWYRNFLMKGFHLVVLLTAGSGIRDTQVLVHDNSSLLPLQFVSLMVPLLLNSLWGFAEWPYLITIWNFTCHSVVSRCSQGLQHGSFLLTSVWNGTFPCNFSSLNVFQTASLAVLLQGGEILNIILDTLYRFSQFESTFIWYLYLIEVNTLFASLRLLLITESV